MKKLFLFALAAVFMAGCAANNQAVKTEPQKEAVPAPADAKAPAAAPEAVPAKVVLFDFEDDKDITGLFKENDGDRNYPIERSPENATSGKYSMKITFPDKGSWPGPHFLEFQRDWSAYDSFKFDCFNPTNQVLKVCFAGADASAGFTEKAYFGEYAKRFGAERIIKPGKNTVEIDLLGTVIEDGSRAVDFKNMKRFAIFMMSRPAGMVLYVDNVRLEKSEEE